MIRALAILAALTAPAAADTASPCELVGKRMVDTIHEHLMQRSASADEFKRFFAERDAIVLRTRETFDTYFGREVCANILFLPDREFERLAAHLYGKAE